MFFCRFPHNVSANMICLLEQGLPLVPEQALHQQKPYTGETIKNNKF